MLELAILGLLKERAMHGYELRKQLAQKLGFFWTVSFGSLYPTLRRLERRGAVQQVPSADLSFRRKQVYRITTDGEQLFFDLLEGGASSSWEEDKFPLRLAFFRYLRPEIRLRLLERRRSYLADRLDEARHSLQRARRGKADPYTLSLARHGMEITQRDIEWLDELIQSERVVVSERDPEGAGRPEPTPESTDEPGHPNKLQNR